MNKTEAGMRRGMGLASSRGRTGALSCAAIRRLPGLRRRTAGELKPPRLWEPQKSSGRSRPLTRGYTPRSDLSSHLCFSSPRGLTIPFLGWLVCHRDDPLQLGEGFPGKGVMPRTRVPAPVDRGVRT